MMFIISFLSLKVFYHLPLTCPSIIKWPPLEMYVMSWFVHHQVCYSHQYTNTYSLWILAKTLRVTTGPFILCRQLIIMWKVFPLTSTPSSRKREDERKVWLLVHVENWTQKQLQTNSLFQVLLQIKVKSGREEGWAWGRLVAADEDCGHEAHNGE